MMAIFSIVAIACALATLVAVALVRSGDERVDHHPLLGRARKPWVEATLLLVIIIILAWTRS